MKMENAEVRFVVFASVDVITTSEIGSDTSVKVIFLTYQSVLNYNAIATPLGHKTLFDDPGYVYSGYSGKINTVTMPVPPQFGGGTYTYSGYAVVTSADTLTSEQRKALYTVSEGNTSEYNTVLTWLTAHKL